MLTDIDVSSSYRKAYEPMLPYFSDFSATIHALIADTEANTVVIHATGQAKTIAGPYNNEYIFILHLNEDATKLKYVEEFVDSFVAKENGARLKAKIAEVKKEESI